MNKVIRTTHITGQKGVNLFESYCLQHNPLIVFRETLKNDFGIDADIEMTAYSQDKKLTPTGEIIKIQIKTDGTGHSYMRNASSNQFEYYATAPDLDYWSKYKSHGLEVILVIVDEPEGIIYCKKVFDYDLVAATATVKKNKNTPILFDKTENKLQFGVHDFREKFSASFGSRVNYFIKETLVANLLKFKAVPKTLFIYESKFKNNKDLAEFIRKKNSPLTFNDCPFNTIYGNKLYSFSQLSKEYELFKTHALISAMVTTVGYEEIQENRVIRNHYAELISQFLQYSLRKKGLIYNRKYKRYYFRFDTSINTAPLTVEAVTKVRRDKINKKVVTWHEYGTRYKFFRHLAFSLTYHFIEGELYLSMAHKYLFTEDGKKTLPPKEITKFTNFLTARDFNDKYYGWLDFWWSYITKDNNSWDVFDFNKITIKINPFYSEDVNFGIPLENRKEKPKLRKHIKPIRQEKTNTLFDNEN